MKNKEYKKVLAHCHISPNSHSSFDENMNYFLKSHPDMKIEQIIVHKPYHVTIIYSELKQTNP